MEEVQVKETPEVMGRELVEITGTLLEVITDVDRIMVGDMIKQAKRYQNKVVRYWKDLKATAHAAHADICSKEKALLEPVQKWEEKAKKECIIYQQEQERIRLKEQARLDKIQREKDEAARKAEADALIEQAISLAKSGDKEAAEEVEAEAEEVEEAPIQHHTAIAPVQAPVVKGQSFSTTYKAEVFSLKLLAKGVGDGSVPVGAIKADMQWLNREAANYKETMKVPGVRAVKKTTMSSSS